MGGCGSRGRSGDLLERGRTTCSGGYRWVDGDDELRGGEIGHETGYGMRAVVSGLILPGEAYAYCLVVVVVVVAN